MARWDINIPIDRARMFVGGEPLSGEIQLDILKQNGLKPHHKLLEIGSGAGHFAKQAIEYLDFSHYYGIEPNQWTMEENKIFDPVFAERLIYKDAHFNNNDQFNFSVFGVDEGYDIIFSHSILSHASEEQLEKYFRQVSEYLAKGGLVLASLHYSLDNDVEHSTEWQYPGISWFNWEFLEETAEKYGLEITPRPDIKEYYMSRREDDWHDWCELRRK